MKARIILYVLFVSIGFGFINAQENIYRTGKTNFNRLYNAVEVEDTVYLSLAVLPGSSTSSSDYFVTKNFKFDLNGNILYRQNYPDTNLVNNWVLGVLGKSSDNSYLYRDAQELPQSNSDTVNNAKFIEKIDLNSGHKNIISFDPDSSNVRHQIYKFLEMGDTLLVAGARIDSLSNTPFWAAIDANGQLLKYYDDYSGNNPSIFNIVIYRDKIIFIHRTVFGLQLELYLKDLTHFKNVNAPNIFPPGQQSRIMHTPLDIVARKDSKSPMGLAMYRNQNVGVIKYNQDFTIASVDSFRFGNSGDKEASGFLDPLDYRSLDSIYGLVNLWSPNYALDGYDQPGRSEGLEVFQFDTTGSINWSKQIKRDSVVYFTKEIIATSDGGALLFSEIFDATYSNDVHSSLSVIKIQGDGSILNEHFYEISQRRSISVYPNPAQDQIWLKGLSLKPGQTRPYQLYGFDGRLETEGTYRAQQGISLTGISPGNYLIRIQAAKGFWHTAQFIKE